MRFRFCVVAALLIPLSGCASMLSECQLVNGLTSRGWAANCRSSHVAVVRERTSCGYANPGDTVCNSSMLAKQPRMQSVPVGDTISG
jgi:hypothetical protein